MCKIIQKSHFSYFIQCRRLTCPLFLLSNSRGKRILALMDKKPYRLYPDNVEELKDQLDYFKKIGRSNTRKSHGFIVLNFLSASALVTDLWHTDQSPYHR